MNDVAIQILHKPHPFAQIDNRALRDKRLSYRARGILGYLLSKPNGWTVRSSDVIANGTEGRDAIRTAFKELSTHGYAKLDTLAGGDGKLGGRVWLVREYPDGDWPDRKPEKPTVGETDRRETRPIKNTDQKRILNHMSVGGLDEVLKQGIRLAQIFGRKKINPADWSEKEQRSFKALTKRGPLDDDDVAMLERYYVANRKKSDSFCRRDLFTLLNNYQGEVDRARDWCERHPAKSRVLRNGSSPTVVEPAVEDPEQKAKFAAAFEEWKEAGRPLGEECDAIFRKHGAMAPQ